MKIKYCGKYNNDESVLPHGELEKHPDAIAFKEIGEYKKFMMFVNTLAVVITVITLAIFLWRADFSNQESPAGMFVASIVSLLTVFPHEIIHALFLNGTVQLYLTGSGAFVVNDVPMSRNRFILMSMAPNLVFGFIPFLIFLLFPQLTVVGFWGAICIPMGAGDYYNVYNAVTQVPVDGMCFFHGMRTYWYPSKSE